MKKIGVLIIGLMLMAHAEFKRGANDKTVIDTETNLEWQDNYSDNNNTIPYIHWRQTMTYCNDLTLDGKKDWRLPNINELKTLIVDTQYAPTIDKEFIHTKSDSYWSSTHRHEYYYAWVINFSNSIIHFIDDNGGTYYGYAYIRCVRDYQ